MSMNEELRYFCFRSGTLLALPLEDPSFLFTDFLTTPCDLLPFEFILLCFFLGTIGSSSSSSSLPSSSSAAATLASDFRFFLPFLLFLTINSESLTSSSLSSSLSIRCTFSSSSASASSGGTYASHPIVTLHYHNK
jgi:hypothetical protein